MTLEILWYAVLGVSIVAYTVLDGFDLGVGALHLCARTDEQRRLFLNAIGPVWDGNEVWIVIVMGGLFAGFPNAYATVFSGFYSLLMILIAALIFRPVAIEFRSKRPSPRWRSTWDTVFCLSSITMAFIMGLLVGNMIEGVPLDAQQNYTGGFTDLFRPYSIIVGFMALALFTMHGAMYLNMKTEGETHATVHRWINKTILVFLFWYLITTIATLLYILHMTQRLYDMPYLGLFPLLSLLAILNIPLQVKKKNDGWAFIFSSLAIISLLILFSLGTFPNIVPSTIDPDHNSVTVFNSASSQHTLMILLIVVAIGVPLVLAYGAWIYRIFRGKVKLEKTSY
jgi:cytochrome d ubiquinol oxidase subunit II